MKPLNEYKKLNFYEDETGCSYETLGDFLQSKVLGHCCCGLPENNLLLIHDLLSMHELYWDKTAKLKEKSWETEWNKWQNCLKEFTQENWKKFLCFFWYVMNDKKIMEHGGSIPGWICDNNFMDAIKFWHENEFKNKEIK